MSTINTQNFQQHLNKTFKIIDIFRCPQYTKLPALCHLKSISGQCCKRLECGKPTTVAPGVVTPTPFIPTPDPNPGCKDALDDCAGYGQSVCKAPYDGWARRNCQHYCSMCRMYNIIHNYNLKGTSLLFINLSLHNLHSVRVMSLFDRYLHIFCQFNIFNPKFPDTLKVYAFYFS